jgi:hypothetical protein
MLKKMSDKPTRSETVLLTNKNWLKRIEKYKQILIKISLIV